MDLPNIEKLLSSKNIPSENLSFKDAGKTLEEEWDKYIYSKQDENWILGVKLDYANEYRFYYKNLWEFCV